MTTLVKSPKIPYPGAKGRLAPALVEMMPTSGRRYVEPLVGRGNVYFAAALSLNFEQWHINDFSTGSFFNALIATKGKIKVPERTREEFEKQKFLFQTGDVGAILLEPYLTFSGGGYKKAGFGGQRSANASGYANTLLLCGKILNLTKPKITKLDWEKLNLSLLTNEDFVFFDPPYFGADVRAYSNNFNHQGMVKLLENAKFKWMLTEYEQPIYLAAFGEPRYRQVVQLACDGRGNRSRTECVWTNY
jgi:site-specific DNA-adenine methylase